MVSKLTNEEIKHIIIHELVHFKRRDTLINWIITVLNLVHWFNPILYFIFKRLRQDSEISCDAKALSYIKGKEHKNYGNTIINLVSLVSSFDVKPWEASMVSKSEIKRRIIMISKFKKRTLIGTLVGVVAACVVCVGILTNAKSQNTNNKAVKAKVSTKAPSKAVTEKTNTDEKDNTAGTINNSSSDNEKSSNTNKTQNTQKQNVNTSKQNSANATQSSGSNNRSTANNSNEGDNYTPEEAAILAINHELGPNNRITAVTKGTSGNGYANFNSDDIGATVLDSVTENGKKYYSVRLYSQSMKKNGGSGTIDNLVIAKDGSIKK
jgi:bla regulator protein BlaR1